jgi:Zn finger protein HypA/HybF involved in hydrogenase expression
MGNIVPVKDSTRGKSMQAQDPIHSWTPPPGFVPVPSKVPGIDVYAPAPPEESEPDARTFHCPQCSGIISYSASDQQLVCPHCGYAQEVTAQVVGLSAERFEFTLQALDQSERGWGVERRSIQCESCNAVFTVGGGELSTTCPFCGSNRVASHTALHDFIRPGYIVPFTVGDDRCQALVKEWLGKGWMHPPSLRHAEHIERFTGIYLPFWAFDARIRAEWKAEVGYEEQRRRYRDGKWETETVIEWRWRHGDVRLPVHNLLIYGTGKLSHVLLEKLYPYDLNALVAYKAGYLAGWQAQAYDTQLKPAWELAKQRMRAQAKDACYADIPTSRVRNFSMTADFDEERWRYMLLPVYLATYTFEDKTYHVMVNGQTGAVAGQKPVDWLRVWLAIGLALLPGILGGLLGLITLPLSGIGMFVLPIAFVLFVVGLIVSIYIFGRARSADDA